MRKLVFLENSWFFLERLEKVTAPSVCRGAGVGGLVDSLLRSRK